MTSTIPGAGLTLTPGSNSRRNSNGSTSTQGTPSSGTPSASRKSSSHAPNGNHLLAFTLPPRQMNPRGNGGPARRSKKGGEGARWNLFNKEKFVNSTYRFVLNPTGDYTAHFADPDIFFHPPSILQILVPPPQLTALTPGKLDPNPPTCPICLGTPVAPRMTKCGHIYCFGCILHFLALGEKGEVVRCPICADAIYARDLKLVKYTSLPSLTYPEMEDLFHESTPFPSSASSSSSSSTHHFTLLRRSTNSTLALPSSAPSLSTPHETPYHFAPSAGEFARFMLATPAYIERELQRDLEDLTQERIDQSRAGEEIGLVFIDAAITQIKDDMVKFDEEFSVAGVGKNVDAVKARLKETARVAEKRKLVQIEREHRRLELEYSTNAAKTATEETTDSSDADVASVPLAYLSTLGHPTLLSSTPITKPETILSSTSKPFIPSSAIPHQPAKPVKPTVAPPISSGESTYHFFQSSSGLPLFLHPLDIKILLSQYKSYSCFPPSLSVPILEVEEGTMNADLRRRCKYLSHLPTGAEIRFVEVDLSNYISKEVLGSFENALKVRKTKRKERVKKEDKERKKGEEIEREREAGLHGFTSASTFYGNGSNLNGRRPSHGRSTAGAGTDFDFDDALESSLRHWQESDDHFSHDDDGYGEYDEDDFHLHHNSNNGDFAPSSSYPPSSSTSLPSSLRLAQAPTWGSSSKSIASTLQSSSKTSGSWARPTINAQEQENQKQVNLLWKQFERDNELVDLNEKGGSKSEGAGSSAGKKGKKMKGQRLVLGGGGGRRG